MYRVSREGRRASNGSTDTPPRTLKQRISKLHSYVPPNGAKDKSYLQDPRVRLGMRIAGILLFLVLVRQVRSVPSIEAEHRALSRCPLVSPNPNYLLVTVILICGPCVRD